MTGRLKQYFPLILEREELFQKINNNSVLKQKFQEWQPCYQEEFLDICTGVKGVKLLYDSFFKEILNPEYTPDRLNRLFSLLPGTSAEIKMVLPGDSTRIPESG